MNRTLALLLIVGLKASSSSIAGELTFGSLKIPSQNILHYDKILESQQVHDIAVIFDEAEIRDNIIGYSNPTTPSGSNTIVIYKDPANLAEIKSSVLSTTSKNAVSERDEYTNLMKIQRTKNSWILIESSINTINIIGQCRRTGISNDIVNCSFRTNLLNYGVKYNLRNSNIALYREYEYFLTRKLCEWSIEPAAACAH